MSKFYIYIGNSTTIVRDDIVNYGTFAPPNKGCTRLPTTGIYANIVQGEVENKTGDIVYLFVGLLSDAEKILGDVADEELFHTEHHFEVWHKDKVVEAFDGMLLDALLFIANKGKDYV